MDQIKISDKISIPVAEYQGYINASQSQDRNHGAVIGGKEKGIIKSDRTWGVELECFTQSRPSYYYGIGTLPDRWGSKGDGSISGEYTREFVTCPMTGIEGEDFFKDATYRLVDAGWKTNTSCGTHCHIAVPEAQRDTTSSEIKIKRLATLYTVFEPVIRCLLPKDRRNNSYCSPIANCFVQIDKDTGRLLMRSSSEKRFDKLYFMKMEGEKMSQESIKRAKRNHRYGNYGINFQSMYYRGTLEIRYHEGTLDPVRLIHWISLHSAIVDLAMKGTITEKMILEYTQIKDVEVLMIALLDLLQNHITRETREYTIGRFEAYKSINPKGGYLESRLCSKIEVVVRNQRHADEIINYAERGGNYYDDY